MTTTTMTGNDRPAKAARPKTSLTRNAEGEASFELGHELLGESAFAAARGSAKHDGLEGHPGHIVVHRATQYPRHNCEQNKDKADQNIRNVLHYISEFPNISVAEKMKLKRTCVDFFRSTRISFHI